MIASKCGCRKQSIARFIARSLPVSAIFLILLLFSPPGRGDEPYARTRDYDLQHSRIALRFDLEQRKVTGDVTHSLAILREGTTKIEFDSVGLTIQSVLLNRSPAKFESTAAKLIVPLRDAAHAGDKFDVEIRYEGKPTKGLYFILPDKDDPNRPNQIWTQGESEDTRYYLPTYDYPNDRLTTETILTVPSSFLTVANGKLISVTDAGKNMKTWTWKEALPSSTYLITVVAGDLDEVKQSWRSIPVTYYAPKGRGNRLLVNYGHTPEMLEVFSKKLGVDYPWEKYSQAMVDDFVAGGMENSSATTNTSSSLRHPDLVPEYPTDADDLISHELGHQWFGDLVTCKDWGDIWLNEGFATFLETVWSEAHFPKDQAEYDRWSHSRSWFQMGSLFARPIVRFDFEDSSEFDGNAYDKGGWVLYMLRHQIGEQAFYRGLRRYLEVNRGKNVVTSDLVKAMEETNYISLDRFFNEWVYGAGAPKFDLSYAYDDAKHHLTLRVKQTQKLDGRVGIFHVPVDVEVTTASGAHLYSVTTSKASETFGFPADSAPLMVLFDKGGHVLKSAEFHKERKEWIYQLKNATEFSDRAEAAVALGKMKEEEAIAALSDAVNSDKAYGARNVAADALGRIGTPAASKALLNALEHNEQPWVRYRIVASLGNFHEPEVGERLERIAKEDRSYRARASALQAIAKTKSANAFATLSAAVAGESPDGFLRDAALRGFGALGDDKAVPLLREWTSPGKPTDSRTAAIASLAKLDKSNPGITAELASYLKEPHFTVRVATIVALGSRGDAGAIPALEALMKSDDLSIEVTPMIKEQIARLSAPHGARAAAASADDDEEEGDGEEPAAGGDSGVPKRLDKLEQLVREMNERLKTIESRLPPKP